MTRIAVTADLHCDEFGSKVDPATGLNARWVDTIDMARWVATDAARRECDALIVAGDFTEARHPAPWRVAQIGEALDAFAGQKIYVRGNHDGQRDGRSIVRVLAAGRYDVAGFDQPGVTVVGDVAIACIPHLEGHWLRAQPGFESVPEADLLRVLADQYLVIAGGLFAQATKRARRRILVVHQGLSGGLMSDTQRAFLGDKSLVVDARALAAQGWDAVLAGHFHGHQVLQADPPVLYAGSPYRTDFGEEHQSKGYVVVDVDEAGVRWEFVETPARRFVTLTADRAWTREDIAGAVVRCLEVGEDPATFRAALEAAGAWDIQELRRIRVETPGVAGGLSDTLTAEEALVEFFDGDPDRDALVERGRAVLAEVA